MQVITPINLERFNELCFQDNSPYSHKVFYELEGLKGVKVEPWFRERNDLRRKVAFTIPESNPIVRVEVKVNCVQRYEFSNQGLTLHSKYTLKHEKYAELDVETHWEVKPINSGGFSSMVVCKLFIYRNDQKKVSKKLLDELTGYFKAEAMYWAKEILEFRLVGDRKLKRRLGSQDLTMTSGEVEKVGSPGTPGDGGSTHREKHIDLKHSVRTYDTNPSMLPSMKSIKKQLLHFYHKVNTPLFSSDINGAIDRMLLIQFFLMIMAVYLLVKITIPL